MYYKDFFEKNNLEVTVTPITYLENCFSARVERAWIIKSEDNSWFSFDGCGVTKEEAVIDLLRVISNKTLIRYFNNDPDNTETEEIDVPHLTFEEE